MKNQFDIVYESLISELEPVADISSDTPQVDSLELQIVEGDSLQEIARKLDTQVKGLKKIASKNTDGGKIYYRTRNIVNLVNQLKESLGVVTSDDSDTEE